jgi:flagellar biosynthesis protein FlhA
MPAILEALADYSPVTRNVQFLTEKARQALARQLCLQYADDEKVLRVLTVEPSLEQKIIASKVETSSGIISAMDPPLQNAWIRALSRAITAVNEHRWLPVILCSEPARFLVRSSTSRDMPGLIVLSVQEIANEITVEAVGEIKIESAA